MRKNSQALQIFPEALQKIPEALQISAQWVPVVGLCDGRLNFAPFVLRSCPFVLLLLHFKETNKPMTLPQDPFILLGVVNMKLRDQYASLDELCEDLQVDRQALEARLAAAGFEYLEAHKRFA